MSNLQYHVDSDALSSALRRKGFTSIQHLARHLRIHRNTIGNYLSGTPALPEALAKILNALDLAPGDVLLRSERTKIVPGVGIAALLEKLYLMQPNCAWVLFGSRARQAAKKYSDYDLGVYGTPRIAFRDLSRLLTVVDQYNAESLLSVQLVDLSAADPDFLASIGKDLVFLGGSFLNWLELLKFAGYEIQERS